MTVTITPSELDFSIGDNIAFGDLLSKFVTTEVERSALSEDAPEADLLELQASSEFEALTHCINAYVLDRIHAAYFPHT
jgi:hypothetical protein